METNKEQKVMNGLEVRFSPMRVNLLLSLFFLFALIGGIFLFNAIWTEQSAYSLGYKIGLLARMAIKEWECAVIFCCWPLLYIALQYVMLYLFSHRERKSIKLHADWLGIGWILQRPMLLKYYRVAQILPSILTAWLPTLHGFCTGSFGWFALGLWGFFCASLDYYLLWKLRPFKDEDHIVNGKQSFDVQILKRMY